MIDYSALANKQNLIMNVFDRYGNKIFQQTNPMAIDGMVPRVEEESLQEHTGILSHGMKMIKRIRP